MIIYETLRTREYYFEDLYEKIFRSDESNRVI